VETGERQSPHGQCNRKSPKILCHRGGEVLIFAPASIHHRGKGVVEGGGGCAKNPGECFRSWSEGRNRKKAGGSWNPFFGNDMGKSPAHTTTHQEGSKERVIRKKGTRIKGTMSRGGGVSTWKNLPAGREKLKENAKPRELESAVEENA